MLSSCSKMVETTLALRVQAPKCKFFTENYHVPKPLSLPCFQMRILPSFCLGFCCRPLFSRPPLTPLSRVWRNLGSAKPTKRTIATVEARKLQYDCPPTPRPREEGKPSLIVPGRHINVWSLLYMLVYGMSTPEDPMFQISLPTTIST